MSELDAILGKDWLTTYRVVIDCERRRVTAYIPGGTRVTFQGDKHDALPQTVYDSRWHGRLMGWLASFTLEDEVRQDLDLPQVVHEYEDAFPDELSGLPPKKDVDFMSKSHPGVSPILQLHIGWRQLSRRNAETRYRNCRTMVILDQALHREALRFYL